MKEQFTFEFNFDKPFSLNQVLYDIYALGAYQACEEFALRLLERYPDNTEAEFIAGLAQAKMGKLSEAEQHITKGLSADNHHGDLEAILALVKANIYNGEFKTSERFCRNIIHQYNSNLAQVYLCLGVALAAMEQSSEAIFAYKTSINLEPSITAYRNLMGLLRGYKAYDEVLEIGIEASKVFPESDVIYAECDHLSREVCDWEAHE
ncbi:MAG: hypothetical protein ACK4PR_03860, partial [Gammaproteobacteria bacterium]